MPRPPLLPTIDWKSVFGGGKSYDEWLEIGDFPNHRDKMKAAQPEVELSPAQEGFLKGLQRPVNVVVIAEDWCGDVVRNVPALERIAAASDLVNTRYIAREDHLDLFARYLTNGGEAIPKIIFLSDQWVECGNWGPMPAQHRLIISRGKAAGKGGDARQRVSALYDSDPHLVETVRELMDLIDTASSVNP